MSSVGERHRGARGAAPFHVVRLRHPVGGLVHEVLPCGGPGLPEAAPCRRLSTVVANRMVCGGVQWGAWLQ